MNFFPWIGDRFGEPNDLGLPARVVLVGESHYGAKDSPHLTEWVVQEVLDGARYRFFTNVFRAVRGPEATQAPETLSSFFHAVAFFNFVQALLALRDVVPTDEQWREGAEVFPKYLDELKPSHVIACGFRLWDNLPNMGFSRCSPEIEQDLLSTVPDRHRGDQSHERRGWIGRYVHAGGSCHIVKIRHPSQGFSPTEWHPVLQWLLQLEIP